MTRGGTTLTWADIARVLALLPPDPIAPENRNVARLRTSPFVPRGQVLRVSAGFFDGGVGAHPIVLMNDRDHADLCAQYRPLTNVDQLIADWIEQRCAEGEIR